MPAITTLNLISKALLYAALFIILISVINFFMQIHPPRFKTKFDPSTVGLKYEEISFKTDDGLNLAGWFIPGNHSRATIIILHGYPFDKANILQATYFLQQHFNLLVFDFRYFGESQGKYTTAGFNEVKDLSAAIEYLKTRNDVDSKKIGVLGFSLGAAVALMSNSKDIRAIIADSSYASISSLLRDMYSNFGPLRSLFVYITKILGKVFIGIDADEISPEKSVANIKIPLLLIHGEADSQIPASHSKAIYANSNKNTTELWIMPGVDHGLGISQYQAEYEKRVMEFFYKNLIVRQVR